AVHYNALAYRTLDPGTTCDRERWWTVPDVRSLVLDTEESGVVSSDREEILCVCELLHQRLCSCNGTDGVATGALGAESGSPANGKDAFATEARRHRAEAARPLPRAGYKC